MAEEFKNVTKENLVYYDSKLKQHISNSIPDSLPASDVYDWAKQPTKPTYTYSEVGAEKSGSVASHNSSTTAHSDIRSLISTVEDSLVSSVSKKSQIQMGTPNSGLSFVPTLKIHRMTQTEYESAVANGTIEENSLYLTPDDPIDLSGYAKKTDITSHTGNTSNPHGVTKAQVGLGNVPNVTTNNQTPTYSDTTTFETLKSGETLTVAFSKIKLAITNLISHIANKSNPHGVTKSQVGLGNVNNTSDADKPISTAVQSALNNKANSSHGTHVSYSSAAPVMDGTAAVGTASTVARSDHKHPTDTSRAAASTLNSHTGNTTVHITADERANWDSAKAHANSAHAPSSAQANVIETVKVNGAALTPSSKAVDITVPTKVSALTNDSGYITSSGTAKTISDILPVSKGGTGKTSAIDAANSFINALSTGSEIPKDADYIVTQYVGGGTTTTTYHRRPIRTLADYVKSKLATVAISGSYNDLNNKPTIPSVGNGTITITQNGNTKGTFTMNQSGNATIALTDTNTTYPAATTTVAGLMSANDKIKLDNIDVEANKIIVDSALSSTSVNPVQNKIVYSAIDNLKFDFAAIEYSIAQKTMVQLITWEAND